MKNYFDYKSTTDLIDSVINGKRLELRKSEKEISLEKVLAFDGTLEDPFQQIYIDKVKNGTYKFFETGDSNWDLYIDENSYLYSIAKEPGCKSTHYGDLNYYKRRKKENIKNSQIFK